MLYRESCEHGNEIKITIFCDVTLGALVHSFWCFREARCSGLQRRRAKVDGRGSSDMWVLTYQTPRRHIQEDNNPNLPRVRTYNSR
jgi:hypothetical protein